MNLRVIQWTVVTWAVVGCSESKDTNKTPADGGKQSTDALVTSDSGTNDAGSLTGIEADCLDYYRALCRAHYACSPVVTQVTFGIGAVDQCPGQVTTELCGQADSCGDVFTPKQKQACLQQIETASCGDELDSVENTGVCCEVNRAIDICTGDEPRVCSDPVDAGTPDTGATDTGTSDTGSSPTDAGADPDATEPDSGTAIDTAACEAVLAGPLCPKLRSCLSIGAAAAESACNTAVNGHENTICTQYLANNPSARLNGADPTAATTCVQNAPCTGITAALATDPSALVDALTAACTL